MDRNRQIKTRTKNTKDRRDNKDKRSIPKNVVETPSKRNENMRNPKTSKKNFPKSISSEKLPMQMRKNDMNERMPESEYKPKIQNKIKLRDNVNSSFDNNGTSYKRNSISKKMNEKLNKENNQNEKISPYNLNNKFERNKTNMNDINNYRRGDRNNNNNNNNFINNNNNNINNNIINSNDKGKNINNFSLINIINEINNRSQNKNIEMLNKNNLFFSPSHQKNYNNDEPQKKLRSASAEKTNVTYSNFINNLKRQMRTSQDAGNLDSKFINKKKKNVFFDFLNQFVNKEKEEQRPSMNALNNNPNIVNKNNVNINANNYNQINPNSNTNNNTTNNTNHNTNRNPNKVRKFRNIHKNRITNFCISASLIKNYNNYNNESMKKELEMRDSKIKELLSVIEQWNNAYNIIVQENQKLKEEINNLKNGINIYNQNNDNNINNKNDLNKYNNNNQNSNFESNHSIKNEKSQYNNLITYNINKNNNYNIINNEINNFNNFVQNKNINNNEPVENNRREPLREKENEQERKARKERKASVAFERFKKMNRMNSAEKEIQRSDKISDMAKMLENHIGGPRRENSVDVCEKIEDVRNNINIDFNNEVVNIIDSQPVVNKKKKKMRSFSYDG